MRDLILVVGAFATGKTYTVELLKKFVSEHTIPFEESVLSDGNTILDNVRKDDEEGGFYHYHEWCLGNINGHTHEHGEPQLPVIVYGNKILDGMYRDLFTNLV